MRQSPKPVNSISGTHDANFTLLTLVPSKLSAIDLHTYLVIAICRCFIEVNKCLKYSVDFCHFIKYFFFGLF